MKCDNNVLMLNLAFVWGNCDFLVIFAIWNIFEKIIRNFCPASGYNKFGTRISRLGEKLGRIGQNGRDNFSTFNVVILD